MSDILESPEKTPVEKRKRWSFWRILGWVLLTILMITLLAAAYVWTNRYTLIEDFARDVLAQDGIEAEFNIKSLTKTRVVIDNVTLTDSNEPFFEAKSIIADYAWRDALDGKMKKLTFQSPKAWLRIDENLKITEGWMPPSDPNSKGLDLPPEGIHVSDGELTLISPYGNIKTEIDANVMSPEHFDADLDIESTQLHYKDLAAVGGGRLALRVRKTDSTLRSDMDFSAIVHPILKAETITIRSDLKAPSLRDPTLITGPINLVYDQLSVGAVSLGAGSLDWVGSLESKRDDMLARGSLALIFDETITPETHTGSGALQWDGTATVERGSEGRADMETLTVIGGWNAQAVNAKLINDARRKTLSEGLTLNSALSTAPISADFADGLTKMASHVFAGVGLEGEGQLRFDPEEISVSLTQPLTLKAPRTTVRASAALSEPFYLYDRSAFRLDLNLDTSFTGQYPATLRAVSLSTASQTGYSIDGVSSFSAKVSTPKTWTSTSSEGRPVRLAPFAATVKYAVGNRRVLSMSGGIDYDGEIPGGYVTGLKTSGNLDVVLLESGLSTKFKPANDDPVTISKFETTAGWHGEDLSFNYVSEPPFYISRGDVGTLDAVLTNASGVLIDDANTRNISMTFDKVEATGALKEGRQDWVLAGEAAEITSDDIIGPGLEIRAAKADMTVAMVPEQPVQFTLVSPSADVKSRLVNADHLQVEASGTPDNFNMDYANGLIKFTADALPALPMTGNVTYANETWTGSAKTFLPKAEDAPIDVVYRFKDGFGEADVTIEKIIFVPGKFQPQALMPALSGKVSRVEGAASAQIKISFGTGQELKSSGTVKLMDMNMGTLPGPLSGVNTEIEFTSLFPLQTRGRQFLTVDQFDPGLPLENGTVEYELIPNGVKIYSASWPMGTGSVNIDPTTWDFGAEENRVTLRIQNVALGAFLAQFGGGDIKATGDVVGILPVVVKGIDVKVEGGVISVPDGGVIQFESRHTDAAGDVNETSQMAFDALKNFKYNALEAKLDGPLDGDISIFLDFIGHNPDVFYGTKFHFKVNIAGELVNIARSMVQTQDVLDLYKKSLLGDEKQPKSPEDQSSEK